MLTSATFSRPIRLEVLCSRAWNCLLGFGVQIFCDNCRSAGSFADSTDKAFRSYGCLSIHARMSIFPKLQLPDSVKKWQGTYFYVRNLTSADGLGCLPSLTRRR